MRHIDVRARAVTRADIEAQIEAMIELLDELDGDPDLEEVDAEDSFALSKRALDRVAGGPGCPVSDPDLAADDVPCDDIDMDLELDPDEGTFSDGGAYRDHLARIRRDRCFPHMKSWRGWDGKIERRLARYVLADEPRSPSARQILRRKRGVPRRPRG